MSEDFGVGFKNFFTGINEKLKSEDSKEKAKAAVVLGLGFMNPLALVTAGIIKGFMGMVDGDNFQSIDAISISDENAMNKEFGDGFFNDEDYTTDIEERPWQAVDIDSITDLSLLDNPEIFPKDKIMAMVTHYTLGDQQLTPEIKDYLEKKLGITISDPPQNTDTGEVYVGINTELLTPNVIKTLSDDQLTQIYNGQKHELTDLQIKYIEARGIGLEETDEVSETEEDTGSAYVAFDPYQITLDEFKQTYATNEQLEEIAQKYKEGTQSLTTEMKAYIEEQLGTTIEDPDFTQMGFEDMSVDDFKALNYNNSQLELIVSQYKANNIELPEEIMNYIQSHVVVDLDEQPIEGELKADDISIEEKVDETEVVEEGTNVNGNPATDDTKVLEDPVNEEIPDIKPSGSNPFALESQTANTNTTIISEDTLYNIQTSVLEEYINLYEENPDSVEFADEHTKAQFMQLYNDYKAEYRKESEDLPDEVKNKLEANAGGTGTT